jgi:hypothetical protein
MFEKDLEGNRRGPIQTLYICLERLKKTTNVLNQDSRCPGRHLDITSPRNLGHYHYTTMSIKLCFVLFNDTLRINFMELSPS